MKRGICLKKNLGTDMSNHEQEYLEDCRPSEGDMIHVPERPRSLIELQREMAKLNARVLAIEAEWMCIKSRQS